MGLPWWSSGIRCCHWLPTVSHHCLALKSSQGMWKCCQWLGVRQWFLFSTLVSSIRPLQFIYLSYKLRRQEMSHFGIKKKVEKCGFFIYYISFRICRLGLVGLCFYQPILNYIKSINQLLPVTWRVGDVHPQVWGSTTALINSCSWLNLPYNEYSWNLHYFFLSLTENFKTTFVRKTTKLTFFFFYFWSLTGFFFKKKLVRQVIELEWPYLQLTSHDL